MMYKCLISHRFKVKATLCTLAQKVKCYLIAYHCFILTNQVQTELTFCNHGTHIFCVCGIAVRAAGDVFVINRCPHLKRNVFGFRSCIDNILDVRKIDELNYKVNEIAVLSINLLKLAIGLAINQSMLTFYHTLLNFLRLDLHANWHIRTDKTLVVQR